MLSAPTVAKCAHRCPITRCADAFTSRLGAPRVRTRPGYPREYPGLVGARV